MVVLGIDPGSRVTGYGVIDWQNNRFRYIDSGCIRLKATMTVEQRLRAIFEGVDQLIGAYKVQILSIEQIFMHQNPQSALKLGQARGAVLVAAGLANIPVYEYTPNTIKKTVVGQGHADKIQVQHMVMQILALSQSPQADAADALAIALCHAFHHRYDQS